MTDLFANDKPLETMGFIYLRDGYLHMLIRDLPVHTRGATSTVPNPRQLTAAYQRMREKMATDPAIVKQLSDIYVKYEHQISEMVRIVTTQYQIVDELEIFHIFGGELATDGPTIEKHTGVHPEDVINHEGSYAPLWQEIKNQLTTPKITVTAVVNGTKLSDLRYTVKI